MKPADKLAAIANAIRALKDLDELALTETYKQQIEQQVLQCLSDLKIIELKQRRRRPHGALQESIIEALKTLEQGTSATIAQAIGKTPNPVNSTMTRLKNRGIVRIVKTVPNPDYGKGSGKRSETVALYELTENYEKLWNEISDDEQ